MMTIDIYNQFLFFVQLSFLLENIRNPSFSGQPFFFPLVSFLGLGIRRICMIDILTSNLGLIFLLSYFSFCQPFLAHFICKTSEFGLFFLAISSWNNFPFFLWNFLFWVWVYVILTWWWVLISIGLVYFFFVLLSFLPVVFHWISDVLFANSSSRS